MMTVALLLAPKLAFAADDEGAPPPLPAAAPEAAPAPPVAPTAPPPKDEPKPEESKAYDYRLPMIGTDLLFAGLLAGSWTAGIADAVSPGVAVAGAVGAYGGFVASGALYHAAFDTRSRTGLSIVVRSLAPAVFAAAGAGAVYDSEARKCKRDDIPESECDHDNTQVGALAGALIGMLGATVAEATILVPDGRKPPPPSKAAFAIVPSVSVAAGGSQVGLTGVF